MTDRLFQRSFYQAWENALGLAAKDVAQLDRQLFSDPALGGHLQKIADKYSFDVAKINKDGVHAKRRTTEREGEDGWGDRRLIKQTWLDFTIPFTGEAESFKIAPSRSIVPSHACSIGKNSLVLTIIDDDNAKNQVDTFITQVNQNLDTLRAEYEQAKPQLDQRISQAAEQRKQQINAENDRDKKLGFPVTN